MKTDRLRISLNDARWVLSKIWFIGGGVILILLIIQTTFGSVYGDRYGEVWSWALPNVMPTLSLIISVLAAGAIARAAEKPTWVKGKYLSLAKTLSICYLSIIFLSIVGAYAVAVSRKSPAGTEVDTLKMSGVWLAPLQSLVVACIGALFYTKEEDPEANQSSKEKAGQV